MPRMMHEQIEYEQEVSEEQTKSRATRPGRIPRTGTQSDSISLHYGMGGVLRLVRADAPQQKIQLIEPPSKREADRRQEERRENSGKGNH